jgi:hypothetical protein
MRRLKVRVRDAPFIRRGVEIYFFEDLGDEKIAIIKDLVFETVERSKSIENKGIHIGNDIAQELMDELWTCGLRPSEGTGSAGSLKATQDHLGDMQKLSWKLLEMMVEKEK